MFRQTDLEAYLDEALPPEEMARIEKAVREDPSLVEQLARVHALRNMGVFSLGDIWRRHRLSCPPREQLGGFLLGAVSEECANYIAFHAKVIGCRYCQANLVDLQSQHAGREQVAHSRRRKYFQSSAGYLQKKNGGGRSEA